MKGLVRQRARELGFDDCRFTTAAPPASAPHLQTWLAAERHGEMTWLARNAPKRTDPQLVLPGVKSIICLAVSYANVPSPESRVPSPPAATPTTDYGSRITDHAPRITDHAPRTTHHASRITHHAPIARYARFTDYHDTLGERLKTLTAFVNQLGETPTRSLWYVDTGPVLERDLAQRAGIGFIGKHTNVISRRFGNWIFLAEILTTLELDPDPAEKNRCGHCTRCLEACPTRAIPAPFQLDARRCISYLTIELKGSIPEELRPLIGNRIFGCDDCLEVCPWNRFARTGQLMQAHARADLATPDLLELLQLDHTDFKRRFAGTPLERTKRRGLLRNVCIALGNIGNAHALPALEKAASDAEPLIAEHARWAIHQIATRNSRST